MPEAPASQAPAPRTPPGQAMLWSPRIAELASERDNNFNLVRFLAATAVIVFHSYALTDHWTDEPLWRLSSGSANLGNLGVTMFFVVSGFLVSKSFVERRAFGAFVAARILRVYPGLLLATVFTIVIAGACSTVSWTAFLGDAQTRDYFWRTASGWSVRDLLPGAFAANPFPHSVNGSLWTLPVELRMYVGCAICGALTLLRRPGPFNVLFALAIAVIAWRPDWFPVAPNDAVVRRLALAFAVGAFAWVNRRHIALSPLAALVALLLLAADPYAITRGVLFVPLLAYVLLTFALHPVLRFAAYNRLGDYSYGLYVYAFPVQQALLVAAPRMSPLQLFAAAFVVTLGLAAASWHGVEKPALGLKSRFRTPAPQHA